MRHIKIHVTNLKKMKALVESVNVLFPPLLSLGYLDWQEVPKSKSGYGLKNLEIGIIFLNENPEDKICKCS